MSVFTRPNDPEGITFMLRGEAGSGKTRFALGARRLAGKTVAYVGNDRGARFYRDDAEVGGFVHVEGADVALTDRAIDEVEKDAGRTFGALVIDTVTELWNATQGKYEKQGKDGVSQVPMRAWRPLRAEHEARLRRIQALPLTVFLICEEKPIYEKDGDERHEVGTREDADKKDSYVSDVRLRFFVERKTFKCEVLKDRTGTFAMGTIVENPRIEMWARAITNDDEIAGPLVARVEAIANLYEAKSWGEKHRAELASMKKTRRAAYEAVLAAMTAKKAALTATEEPSDPPPPGEVAA
jgi:hypothetical protein